TRAGIHVLAFRQQGGGAPRARADAYQRGLDESVAGLAVLDRKPLRRFGLSGVELTYEGGATPRMRSVDWVLFGSEVVYVVKVIAPIARWAELSPPLLTARDSLTIRAP